MTMMRTLLLSGLFGLLAFGFQPTTSVVAQVRNKGVDPEWAAKLRDAPRHGMFSHNLPRSVFLTIYGNMAQGSFRGPVFAPKEGWMFGGLKRGPNGDWQYMYGDGLKARKTLPPDRQNKLEELLGKYNGEPNKIYDYQIKFAPNDGWIFLYKQESNPGVFSRVVTSKAAYSNLSKDFENKLEELLRRRALVEHVAFTPTGGWLIIYDRYNYEYSNIPKEAISVLADLNKRGKWTFGVEFGPKDSWYILAQLR